MAMQKVEVDGLALDMLTQSPVVILSLSGTKKVLPIWIGQAEAMVIAMALSKISAVRPLTHDLLKSILKALSASVEKVEITELKEQTFYARVFLKSNGDAYDFDARPSDSIALALKSGAPIFAEDSLFNLQAPPPGDTEDAPTDTESLKDRLKRINPEDFGKYQL